MILAFLIAGPAVLLAIMAWAADRFMPVPSNGRQAQPQRRSSVASETVRDSLARSATARHSLDGVRQNIDQTQASDEPSSLAEALGRLEAKRSSSMSKDLFPDPYHHRYDDLDVIEAVDQKLIFQKNKLIRVEPRYGEKKLVET